MIKFQLSLAISIEHDHALSSTIINYHRVPCSFDMFKFDMITDASLLSFNERMIVYDSFSINDFSKNGF